MKFYLLSPQVAPNPVLFPTMIDTFVGAGHSFVNSIEDADVVMWDLHVRSHEYKQSDLDFIKDNYVAVATFDEWDRGGMSAEEWPYPLTPQQEEVFWEIKYDAIHFCRLLDKTKEYPLNLHPYEKPIFSAEEPLLTPIELFNRPHDIFFVANSAPQRESVKKAFEEDGRFKCNIVLGAPKIPFDEWKDMCGQSKAFLKISGGGYSCERLQALWATSLMIMEDTDQLLAHPFTQALNCIKISPTPTPQELTDIYNVLKNQRALYYLYQNQYNFVKEHYSKEAISKDILEKITQHLCQK